MTNKPLPAITELDLPPVSEGTPPLPLARPRFRSGSTQIGPAFRPDPTFVNATSVNAISVNAESRHEAESRSEAERRDGAERRGEADFRDEAQFNDEAEFNDEPDSGDRVEPRKVPSAPCTTLVTGDVVADRYRIGPVIGAGGMGIVYKAQHIELGTWVAIKVIRPDIAQNSSLWRRFAREARALAALHNKHVVRVHDAGTLPSGLRYLVMELLDGTDLRRLISERGPMQVPEAVDHVLQVCSALGDAHRLHIIHRDIKPENIFLARFRACDPTIKLLDFGVARFLDDAGQLTVPGRGVGSPRYLSPEQLQNPGTADQRSDLWGVGLLLYELISGRSPFHEMNTGRVCLTIAQGPIPSITALCPDLPPALSEAIMRCLEIDPARRFQSADELSAALEPFSSRHPVAGPPVGPPTNPQEGREKVKGANDEPVTKPKHPWSGLVPRWLCGVHPG